MKRYILIAGVNGAGKSTLFQINDSLQNMPRINVDEIVKEIGSWQNVNDVFKAGKIAVEIAKDRVKYRVKQGGHGIPESDIEKRYEETFQQLNSILDKCSLIAFYDNTEKFRRFAICKNNELVRISQNVPSWFDRINIIK